MQKEMLKSNGRKFLLWLFTHAQQEVMRRNFIKKTINKETTLQNFKKNEKITFIMEKVYF